MGYAQSSRYIASMLRNTATTKYPQLPLSILNYLLLSYPSYLPYHRYIASIWTGIGVTIAFTLVGSGVACFVLHRAELKARGTPETEANAPLAEGEVAIDVEGGKGGKKKRFGGLFGAKRKKNNEGELVVRPPVGPPPAAIGPPPSVPSTRASAAEETGELEDGWRRVEDDDGDVYFYHEESGESRWEAPLKYGSSSNSRNSTVAVAQMVAPP